MSARNHPPTNPPTHPKKQLKDAKSLLEHHEVVLYPQSVTDGCMVEGKPVLRESRQGDNDFQAAILRYVFSPTHPPTHPLTYLLFSTHPPTHQLKQKQLYPLLCASPLEGRPSGPPRCSRQWEASAGDFYARWGRDFD